jgi:hypothetical protein
MSVLSAVVAALDAAKATGYRREIAEALASALDDPDRVNASTAGKLDALMSDLTGGAVKAEVNASDDLAAKRAARRSASGS